jgi:hypothetical protein
LAIVPVQDDVMLAALDKNPFVVMGSPYRDIDYERVWNNELNKRAGRKARQSTGQAGVVVVVAVVVLVVVVMVVLTPLQQLQDVGPGLVLLTPG